MKTASTNRFLVAAIVVAQFFFQFGLFAAPCPVNSPIYKQGSIYTTFTYHDIYDWVNYGYEVYDDEGNYLYYQDDWVYQVVDTIVYENDYITFSGLNPNGVYDFYIDWEYGGTQQIGTNVTGVTTKTYVFTYDIEDDFILDAWGWGSEPTFAGSGSIAAEPSPSSAGQRIASNGGLLKLVGTNSGSRSALVTLSPDCDTFEPGYPTWSGSNLSGSGPTTRTFSGGPGTSSTITAAIKQGVSYSVAVQVVPEELLQYTLNSSSIKASFEGPFGQAMIQLMSVTSDTGISITPSGQIQFTAKRVDRYNDAANIGNYVSGSGSLALNISGLSFSKTIPLGASGLQAKLSASASSANFSLSTAGIWNDSTPNPPNLSVTGSAGTTMTLSGAVGVIGDFCNLTASGAAPISISLTGPGSTYGSYTFNGSISGGPLTASITANAKFGGDFACSIQLFSHTWGSALSYPLGPWTFQ